MVKTRVYELAKELNLDNKVLVERIRELKIEVKNHMSSLSPEEVKIIKDQLIGLRSQVVEETRIKPTVIRRRKHMVEAASEEIEPVPPQPEPPSLREESSVPSGLPEAPEPKIKGPEPLKDLPLHETKASGLPLQKEVPAPVPPERKAPPSLKKPAGKTAKDTPAKIIRPAAPRPASRAPPGTAAWRARRAPAPPAPS